MRLRIVAALLLGGLWWGCRSHEGAFRSLSFSDAQAEAKQTKTLVLVDFFTTWCGPCKRLDQATWPDADVRAWIKGHAVAIRVDAEKDEKLASRYHVESYPTILLVRADGTEAGRIVGFRKPAEFVAEANDLLAGRDEIARARAAVKADTKGDPELHMKLGMTLAERGKQAEALKEYLWAFDHGLGSPGFTGVRRSFLLSYLVNLGGRYRPAMAALRSRRARLADAVAAGDGSFDTIADLTSIDGALDEKTRTLELYDRLSAKGGASDKARAQLFGEVVDLLIEHKRYQDVLAGAPDPVATVAKDIEQARTIVKYLGELPKEEREETVGYFRKSAIEKAGRFYEACLGANHPDVAGRLVEAALDCAATGETCSLLMDHAVRAGHPESAHAVAAAGRKRIGWWHHADRTAINKAEAALAAPAPHHGT